MNQNNQRKEPTFGEPSITPEVEVSEPKLDTKPYVSLRSTQSPGYTFTPIMQRPEEAVPENVAAEPNNVETAREIELSTEYTPQPVKEFAFTPTVENVHIEEEKSENVVISSQTETMEAVKMEEKVATTGFTTERIIPNIAVGTAAAATAAASTAAIKAKMPAKTRRLLLVALLALALLVLFFLLRPSTPETVEELQSQQGSSLPIEFRPVDEEEAKRAEEQARAEQEAAAKAQELQAQALQAQQAQETAQQSTVAQPATSAQPEISTNQTQQTAEQTVPVKALENKPVVTQSVVKPQTQNSVVYQPETATKPQAKAQAQTKVETAKTESKPVRVTTQKEQPKAVSKPTAEKEKTVVKSEAVANIASTKTMTVPKGVSLMQVFRDNNLNISDVNAMSKTNNIVSNLKVGERVTVRLDKNNRVIEMSISSGGKFTRQANGSYTFK